MSAFAKDAFGNALGSSISIKYNLTEKGSAFGGKAREKFDAAIESLKSRFQKDQSSYMFANANMSDYFRMSPMDRWDLDSSEGILDASGLPVRLSGPGSAGSDTGLGADLGIDPVEQADLQRVLDKENRQMEVDALRDDPKALQEFLISKGHTVLVKQNRTLFVERFQSELATRHC